MTRDNKILPLDPDNWDPMYVTFRDTSVAISGSAFGEIDVERSVFMSHDQFKELIRRYKDFYESS